VSSNPQAGFAGLISTSPAPQKSDPRPKAPRPDPMMAASVSSTRNSSCLPKWLVIAVIPRHDGSSFS